ncbi:uncharacterized protein VTP21DRAFT_4673 [Calcarisporiella thermophila]|uniref:uncharacterized protein n=1 Tax=Calcarisporiella thermophila TaxID=911321 RepID=UPI0037433B08
MSPFVARLISTSARRGFSSSSVARSEANGGIFGSAKKPVGGFRGGIIGFIFGAALAGGAGYYYLLDEYRTASSLLLHSVEELQSSTNKVREYAKKIESVDKDLKKLRTSAATTEQLNDLRNELKKLYDSLNIEHLELKTHVYTLEQDLHKAAGGVSKNNH